MNNNSKYLIPFLLMVFLTIGLFLGTRLNQKNIQPEYSKYSKMQEIINLLDKEYVDTIQSKKLFEETISDMLHKLDPHSNYIPAEDLKAVNEQIDGKFGGVGIRFAIIRDTLCVTNVVPNSPSNKVGIKAGDKIISIQGKSIASKKLKSTEVQAKLKGDPGTQVKVEVFRNNKKITKVIERGIIPIGSIACAEMLGDDIGYIRLETFSVTSAAEFELAANKLLLKGMKKLIFDLRDNGGGVLSGAVQIADEFLPVGRKILMVKGKRYENTNYFAKSGGLLENIQLAVLINENSASASEILAGAIQDNDRGVVIGRRSFGKGLVQQDFSLTDKSDVRLTVARYYTPSGRSIQKPFGKSYEDYYHRSEDEGEFFKPDSTKFKDAKKFKTRKGRTVFEGGGIMPDIFVPLDTSNSTMYYISLRYSGAFQQAAFDFVANKRNKWSSIAHFIAFYQVSDKDLKFLTDFAQHEMKIPFDKQEFSRSKSLIALIYKAEIARQLFIEDGYFMVLAATNDEVRKAFSTLRKGVPVN